MRKSVKLCAVTGSAVVAGWVYQGVSLLCLPVLLEPLGQPQGSIVCYLVNFLCTLLIFRDFLRRSADQTAKHPGRFFWAIVWGYCLCRLWSFAAGWALEALVPGFVNQNDRAILEMVEKAPVWMLLSVMVLVPAAEECLFRGLIFSRLYNENKIYAYALSALAFGAIHVLGHVGTVGPAQLALSFLQYLPTALVLAGSYAYCGSIFAPMLIHCAINATAYLLLR